MEANNPALGVCTNHMELHQDHSEDNNSHVHFSVEQVVSHESEIQVTPAGEDALQVHLGFLQMKHSYEITFIIKDRLGEDIVADPLQNLHVKLQKYEPTEDGEGHQITVLFIAYKEKLMDEQLTIFDKNDESKKLQLIFRARVLGKGKGTPALRNGIHCVKVEWDDDSEYSDWQGFN